jgi:hypothetical protein
MSKKIELVRKTDPKLEGVTGNEGPDDSGLVGATNHPGNPGDPNEPGIPEVLVERTKPWVSEPGTKIGLEPHGPENNYEAKEEKIHMIAKEIIMGAFPSVGLKELDRFLDDDGVYSLERKIVEGPEALVKYFRERYPAYYTGSQQSRRTYLANNISAIHVDGVGVIIDGVFLPGYKIVDIVNLDGLVIERAVRR